jgi:8-amino-7-oxononanoate synthase
MLSIKRREISHKENNFIVIKKRSLINFTQNDYLCLATHPLVKKAFRNAAEKYGLGSGASASLAGYYDAHRELEERMAEFLQRDRALLFHSGFAANMGVITTLADRHTNVYADKLCHASILDGIQLSRARLHRFTHNNVEHASTLLDQSSKKNVIITESVFSMNGDISPIDKFAQLAKKHQAMLIIDDAHGIGVLGQNGRGITEHFQLSQLDVPCLVTPLGKAFGSMGAVVSGNASLIEHVMQGARSYRYTTALPPAIAIATMAALTIVQQETWRREKLHSLIQFFNREAMLRRLPLLSTDFTPIRSILVADNQRALNMQTMLHEKGFFISCIRPPTVPANSARLRISLHCMLEEKDILKLLDFIAEMLS